MEPNQIEIVGDFLALRWPSGEELVLPLVILRRRCPCARCAGEKDLLGRPTFGGSPQDEPSGAAAEVANWEKVGRYALNLRWADGHDTGIYSWAALRQLHQELEAPGS